MHLHGIVQAADLEENPPESGNIELVLKVQGVGPGQPRKIVVPFALLVRDPTLDPDTIQGHAFHAEVVEADARRWVVAEVVIAARRVLRPPS